MSDQSTIRQLYHDRDLGLLTKGGPYEDESFAAGYECGMIDMSLEVGAAIKIESASYTVRVAELAQLDRIAMRHGFLMEVEAIDLGGVANLGDTPTWAFVTFRRGGGS